MVNISNTTNLQQFCYNTSIYSYYILRLILNLKLIRYYVIHNNCKQGGVRRYKYVYILCIIYLRSDIIIHVYTLLIRIQNNCQEIKTGYSTHVPPFMETECSLPCSKKSVTGIYADTHCFFKSHFECFLFKKSCPFRFSDESFIFNCNLYLIS
jgi:hypothetical protein